VPVLEEGIHFLVVHLGVRDNHLENRRMSGRNMSVISV
jgi:thiamine biosynthesis protein ThiC